MTFHIETNTRRHCYRRDNVAIDRISTLPDDLLIDVLSFLSTKEAVQTCILAKRWRDTWKSVPVLNFKVREFVRSYDEIDEEKINLCKDKFDQFVHGVLENRGRSYLDKFQYVRGINENWSEVSREWLDRVATLMPRVIRVFICGKNMLDMSDLFFSCPSLQEIELTLLAYNQITFIRPKLINLPSLKVLNLECVDLDDDFGRQLFLRCPSLESLYLSFCALGFSDISSKVMETLALKNCRYLKQMQICCPSLISLYIDSRFPSRCISLTNTTSLANLDMTLDVNEVLFDDDRKILRVLSNVSTMKLELWNPKENFNKNIPNRINFNNLKTLDLERLNLTNGKNLVAFFLRHSPQLQKLTLRLFNPSEDTPEEPSEEELVEVFQRDYLDTVRIIKSKYYRIGKWKMNDPLLRLMIKYLHDLIKKIGHIITS